MSLPVADRCIDYLLLALRKTGNEAEAIMKLIRDKKLDVAYENKPRKHYRILGRLIIRLWEITNDKTVQEVYPWYFPLWKIDWFNHLHLHLPNERLAKYVERALEEWRALRPEDAPGWLEAGEMIAPPGLVDYFTYKGDFERPWSILKIVEEREEKVHEMYPHKITGACLYVSTRRAMMAADRWGRRELAIHLGEWLLSKMKEKEWMIQNGVHKEHVEGLKRKMADCPP